MHNTQPLSFTIKITLMLPWQKFYSYTLFFFLFYKNISDISKRRKKCPYMYEWLWTILLYTFQNYINRNF